MDTREGRIIDDGELKQRYIDEQPYEQWLKENLIPLENLPNPKNIHGTDPDTLLQRQQVFGYTHEELRILVAPMASKGEEPIGSMGTDAALAVLSNRPRLLYDYFKAVICPGHQSAPGRHPRGTGHPGLRDRRSGSQPAETGS